MTSHDGTYVLQWKFFERPSPHSTLDDVIDSITQHKAKVMYYFETLSSTDYKGSMTRLVSVSAVGRTSFYNFFLSPSFIHSLQSCQSAFSTISKASKHSTSGVSSGVSSSHSDKLAAINK